MGESRRVGGRAAAAAPSLGAAVGQGAGESQQDGGLVKPLPQPLLKPPAVSTVANPIDPDPDWLATFPHPKRTARRKPPRKPLAVRQRWTTPQHVAAYFGVSYETVCRWLRRKNLGAFVAHTRHYTDDRPRKSLRGRWRIFERDLETLLGLMRVKMRDAGFGPGFWVGGE